MGLGNVFAAAGDAITGGLSWYQKQRETDLDDQRLRQQADIANQRTQVSLILQELRNAGVLGAIDARGQKAQELEGTRQGGRLELEGVRQEGRTGLEEQRQEGRVDLSNVNFGHSMDLAEFNQGEATKRTGMTTATTRRGQDIAAGTQRRGQDLSFGANTFATDSANRRSLVPRPNTSMPFGGVNLPQLSYDKYFEQPPELPTDTAPPTPAPAPAAPPAAATPQATTRPPSAPAAPTGQAESRLRQQMQTLTQQIRGVRDPKQQDTLKRQLATIREQYRQLTGR